MKKGGPLIGGSIRQEKKEETCQQSQIELNQQVDTIEICNKER